MEKKPESIFINRELSWLDFDSRVLALAKEKTVPLGERIKFAAIFGSNMDEFFMVRVGSLYDQTLLKTNKTDNVTHMTAAEQINAITPRVAELQAKCDKYFQHLVSALAEQGYHKVDFTKLSKQQEHFWKTYFQRELLPLLSPQIVDSRHPFPFLNNKDIYYIAQLHSKNEGVSYGIVPVSSQFERVLFVKDGETACFAFVEELIAHYAATIFTASTVQKQCLFRVTRNADITVDEGMMDHDVDFRDVMSELLKKRRKLAAVRLQFWPEAPQEVVKFLRDKLVVPADRCYTQTSPLDAGALFKLAVRISGDSGHADLFYPAARPMQAPAGYDLYTEVRKHDVLLAYPYQSIRPFIKMLLRAAADPDVVSIKMTLYRMASDSQIVNALIAAAENGLVGMVCEVDATTCKVRTILSPDIQVGVLNSRTSDSGIVTGSSKYSDDNLSLMTKIPAQHTMQEGDIIVTSGLGGIFPQKIRIGEIKEIKLDEYDSQPMAIIKPYENIQEVSLVAIITNYLGKGTISKSESSKESSKQESTASKQ